MLHFLWAPKGSSSKTISKPWPSNSATLPSLLKLSTLSLATGIGLAQIYQLFDGLFFHRGLWLAATTVNTLLALGLVGRKGFPLLGFGLALGALLRIAVPTLSSEQAFSILLVPVVEETVFRKYIGKAFRESTPTWLLGSYFSALTFSWLHSIPSLSRLLHGQTGVALGPFVLAMFCEVLYVFSGRLWPAIIFHILCNTAILVM